MTSSSDGAAPSGPANGTSTKLTSSATTTDKAATAGTMSKETPSTADHKPASPAPSFGGRRGDDFTTDTATSSPRSTHALSTTSSNNSNNARTGSGPNPLDIFGASSSKTRSSSLAPGPLSSSHTSGGGTGSGRSSSLALHHDLVSGSPREQRLYERGAHGLSTTPSGSSILSSSYPSASPWLDQPPSTAPIPSTGSSSTNPSGTSDAMGSSTATSPSRTSLSRHLSLSGSVPRSFNERHHQQPGSTSNEGGSAPHRSVSSSIASPYSGWPDSPLSFTSDAPLPPLQQGASAGMDAREGRSRTRLFGGTGIGLNPSPSRAATMGVGFDNARSSSIANSRGGPFGGVEGSDMATSVGRNGLANLGIASKAGSGSAGGIATSNMSPFRRDIGALPSLPNSAYPSQQYPPSLSSSLSGVAGQPSSTSAYPRQSAASPTSAKAPSLPHPYSASYTGSSAFDNYRSQGPATATGSHFSLGAVGSGRMPRRRESFWGDGMLHHSRGFFDDDGEENEQQRYRYGIEEDDEEEYAPPTRSGATSRRHSVAAFTSSASISTITSPPMRSQIGFHLPNDSRTTPSDGAGTNGHQHGRSASSSLTQPHHGGFGGFDDDESGAAIYGSSVSGARGGSSRIDDDDLLLATDLSNALQLNLDKQASRERSYSPNRSLRESDLGPHAISLPAQMSSHFGFGQSGSSLPRGGAGESPYSTTGVAMAGRPLASGQLGGTVIPSVSPPRNRTTRAASTSGDPYSPSASAARFLATAHNVQPPPLPPASMQGTTTASHASHHQQQHPGQPADSSVSSLWPPHSANVFSQTSPHFRSGTLPPPEALQSFGAPSNQTTPGGLPPPQSAYSPSSPQQRQFDFGSPGGQQNQQQMGLQGQNLPMSRNAQARSPGSMMPPFAGFGGIMGTGHHHAGGATATISALNAHAQPYYVAPIAPQPNLNDLGRGVPLHALPAGGVGPDFMLCELAHRGAMLTFTRTSVALVLSITASVHRRIQSWTYRSLLR